MKVTFVLKAKQGNEDIVKMLEINSEECIIPEIGENVVFSGIQNCDFGSAIARVSQVCNVVDLAGSEVFLCVFCTAEQKLPYGVGITQML